MRNYTQEERQAYMKEKAERLEAQILEIAKTWRETPEALAEFIQFQQQFHNYSARNCALIYSQNPNASFVGSYKFYKDRGYFVKKGSTGLTVLVPTPTTFYRTRPDAPWKRVSDATDEQKRLIRAGALETYQKMSFRYGTVFDVSQTTMPREDYPKLLGLGYNSAQHRAIYAALCGYTNQIGFTTEEKDLQSVTLRGEFLHARNQIVINSSLGDTQKLSTLLHELAHGVLDHGKRRDITTAHREFEADALSIMFNSAFAVEITDARRKHLADNYRTLVEEIESAGGTVDHAALFEPVMDAYSQYGETMQRIVNQKLGITEPELLSSAPLLKKPNIPVAPTPTPKPRRISNAAEGYRMLGVLFPDVMSQKYSYMRLEAGVGMEPLSLEWLDRHTLSIMHTFVQNGDLMRDPEIVVRVDDRAKIVQPISYQLDAAGLYQETGFGQDVNLPLRGNLNETLAIWLHNIEKQGYKPVRAIQIVEGEDVEVTFPKENVLEDRDALPLIDPEEPVLAINFPPPTHEAQVLHKILYSLKIEDVTLDYDDAGLVATDGDNTWRGEEFYRFLADEAFVLQEDGSVLGINEDLLAEFKALSEQNGVTVGIDERRYEWDTSSVKFEHHDFSDEDDLRIGKVHNLTGVTLRIIPEDPKIPEDPPAPSITIPPYGYVNLLHYDEHYMLRNQILNGEFKVFATVRPPEQAIEINVALSERLFVDMDGTTAQFHAEDNYLERMWEPGFFEGLKPYENAVEGLRLCMQQHPDTEVYILSSAIQGEPPSCETQKNVWLDKHLPEIDANHRIFPPVGADKTAYIPGGVRATDHLLDDYNKNLTAWREAGGHSIKFVNHINDRGLVGERWDGDRVWYNKPAEAICADLSARLGYEAAIERDELIQPGGSIPEDIPIYRLYQLRSGDPDLFFNMSWLVSHDTAPDPNRYELVYEAPYKGETLNELYYRFNEAHPEDFTGRSMSVSDVVVLPTESGGFSAHFVDSIDFVEIPDFVQKLELMQHTAPQVEIDTTGKEHEVFVSRTQRQQLTEEYRAEAAELLKTAVPGIDQTMVTACSSFATDRALEKLGFPTDPAMKSMLADLCKNMSPAEVELWLRRSCNCGDYLAARHLTDSLEVSQGLKTEASSSPDLSEPMSPEP